MTSSSEALDLPLMRPVARTGSLDLACDEDLMATFRASACEEAFDELFRRHAKAAYRTALSILGEPSACEDALQECFLRVVRARRSYRPGRPFSPWFFTILRNTCRDELRRPRPVTPAPATVTDVDHVPDPSVALEWQEEVRQARRAFSLLPGPEREALALRIYGGLQFADVAAACGISAEAAKKRAYRGLARLRCSLAASGS